MKQFSHCTSLSYAVLWSLESFFPLLSIVEREIGNAQVFKRWLKEFKIPRLAGKKALDNISVKVFHLCCMFEMESFLVNCTVFDSAYFHFYDGSPSQLARQLRALITIDPYTP